MSGSQKALKIISIIMIVWAVLLVVMGAFLAAGSQVPGVSGESINFDGTSMDMSTAAIGMGVGFVIAGVIDLIIALLGLRGAKNPKKIGVFFVLCIIGLVLGVVGMAMQVMQGTFQWSSLISLALVLVCTVLAGSIKKQA